MIIECPECGEKNQTAQPPQPGKRYRCGKCGASITFLQTADTQGEPTPSRGAEASENTSGQGSLAVIPEEIRGWNWGAFLLNWIWGLGNSVWIALLALIPYIGFVMAIVLGVKGNEWAWQKKRWDSIEHFKRTQRTWTRWGIGLLVVPLVLGILAAVVIPNVGRFVGRGETEAASTELSNVQAATVALMVDNELSVLPNPVTVATNDMSAFPDTSLVGIGKIEDTYGNTFTAGDKGGYSLYAHDITADGSTSALVNYVVVRYTKGTYTVDKYGTVTQVTFGYE